MNDKVTEGDAATEQFLHDAQIYAALTERFPIEAYSKDSSRGFALTSLKARWIKERLNTVFGIFGWEFEENFVEKTNGVICHGRLTVVDPKNPERKRSVPATGGCAFKEKAQTISDTYKSAATESLSKATSYIGIGNEMYKGNIGTKELGKDRGKFDVALKAIKSTAKKEELLALERMVNDRKWEAEEVAALTTAIKEQRSLEKTVANVR